jgi:hypothetical protein
MTKIWILIVWFHVGPMSSKDSMTMISVPNFETQQQCEIAGKTAAEMKQGTVKESKFVCVQGVK